MRNADPLDRQGGLSDETTALAFLAVNTSPELRLAVYGGFLLFDAAGRVVAVQEGSTPNGDDVSFEAPRPWRTEFSAQLEPRLRHVTTPFIRRGGASRVCFVLPGEELAYGPELWTPSVTGAFMFQMHDDGELFFSLSF